MRCYSVLRDRRTEDSDQKTEAGKRICIDELSFINVIPSHRLRVGEFFLIFKVTVEPQKAHTGSQKVRTVRVSEIAHCLLSSVF